MLLVYVCGLYSQKTEEVDVQLKAHLVKLKSKFNDIVTYQVKTVYPINVLLFCYI